VELIDWGCDRGPKQHGLQLKARCLQLINNYLSSESFIERIVAFARVDQGRLQKLLMHTFTGVLVHLRNTWSHDAGVSEHAAVLKQIGDTTYEIIEKLSDLLTIPSFVKCLHQLIENQDPQVDGTPLCARWCL
jgi:hypothetical protein